MKEQDMQRTATFVMNCRYCDKYMGIIAIPIKSFEESKSKGKEVIDFLQKTKTFPVCDVCTATLSTKLGLGPSSGVDV